MLFIWEDMLRDDHSEFENAVKKAWIASISSSVK
jgi:hypothetical protein